MNWQKFLGKENLIEFEIISRYAAEYDQAECEVCGKGFGEQKYLGQGKDTKYNNLLCTYTICRKCALELKEGKNEYPAN